MTPAAHANKWIITATVMLGTFMEVVPLFDVPPEAFTPPPRVNSSVVRMRPRPAGSLVVEDPKLLATVVTQAFSQRRKTLRNALKGHASDADMAAVGIDPETRAERVPIDTWARLANHLADPGT